MSDFDPDKYLASKKAAAPAGPFDPDKYLASKSPMSMGESALHGAEQGATFGLWDEGVGAVDAAGQAMGVRNLAPKNIAHAVLGMASPLALAAAKASGLMDSDSPELQAPSGLEKIPENYRAKRDEARSIAHQAKASNPKSFITGEIAGSIASPVGQLARGGSLAKTVASGAGLGGLSAFGNSEADNVGDLAKDTAVGAGLGAVGGVAARGVEKGIEAAAPVVADKLKSLAETKAFKAAGAMLKDFRKGASRGDIEETGRFILDNGLMSGGDSAANIAEKAEAFREQVGDQLGKGYDAAAKILPKLGDEATAKVNAAGFNPVRDKAEILAAAKDELGYSFRAKQALGQLEDYIDELAAKHGDQTLNPKLTNQIKSALDKTAIHWERNPLAREPDTEAAVKAFRGFLGDKVTSQVEAIGDAIGNSQAKQVLVDLNGKYGMASKVARMAGDKANRESANQMLGLTDTIVGAGATAARASAGDPLAILKGLGMAGASKVLRTRGNSALAASADSAGRAIRAAGQAGLPQAADSAVAQFAGKSATSDIVRAAAKKDELDKDSSTPATEPPMKQKPGSMNEPTKGPNKWASDGHAKLIKHADDDATKQALESAKPDMMKDPKQKQMLIAASDLKPGSKAMEQMLSRIKNARKK